MLPLEKIRQAATSKFSEEDPLFLQYGNIYGFPKFRQSVSKFLTEQYNHPVRPDQLMATNGNTGGLSLILSLFCKAGDLVFAEEPTYFLAKSIFKDYNLNCHQIPMDKDGVIVSKVEQDLLRMEAANKKPVLMYIVPTAHNPTGRTLTHERRVKLVELCKKHDIMLICDEVYQLLTFPHITPPPPMFTYDPDGTTVLAMGSFSKILCPALRVGWIQSGAEILAKIAACGQLDSSGGLNPVSFGIVQKCIDLGLMDSHLSETREKLYQRYSSLQAALDTALGENQGLGMSYEVPQGGYFVLVKLPEGQVAADMLKVALGNKVAFLPGGGFAQNMKHCLRLSFSMYSAEDLATGITRLIQSVKEYQAGL